MSDNKEITLEDIHTALVAILAHLMADEGGLPKKPDVMKEATKQALARIKQVKDITPESE